MLKIIRLLFFRYQVFNDRHASSKVENLQEIRNYVTANDIECSIRCAQHAECLSVNLCNQIICSLKAGDAFTVGSEMVPDMNCKYIGMKSEEYPRCAETGVAKPITDNNAFICNISRKRTDPEWGDWNNEFEDELSSTEWQRWEKGSCLLGSHLENLNCTVGENRRLVGWVVAVRELKSIDEATNYCAAELDATVWGEMDGTFVAFEPVLKMFDSNTSIFLSISDKCNEGLWLNLRGEDVTNLIPWQTPEPTNSK